VPLEIAWNMLSEALPTHGLSNSPEPEDQVLLRDVWAEYSDPPAFVEQAFLALAAYAGSKSVLEYVVPTLANELPATQVLAVNALAAIPGWDVRRTEDGMLRPLSEVVAEYQRECNAPTVPERLNSTDGSDAVELGH